MRIGPYDLDTIITGDALQLGQAIPRESVHMIFTDPPYPRKYIAAFESLSQCSHTLKQGGRLLCLVGHYQLPEAMSALGQKLTYDWIIAQAAPGRTAAMFQKRVWASWKPCLVYRNGTITSHMNFAMDLFTDSRDSFAFAKTFHKWGQGAPFFAYYIERWTQPNDIILDPFCGGGTVPAVCKMLGRHYLAFEIDSVAAEKARKRVHDTQPPLFEPEPHTTPMVLV